MRKSILRPLFMISMVSSLLYTVQANTKDTDMPIKMGNRYFDLRVATQDIFWTPEFFPINDVDWIYKLLLKDEEFKHTVVIINAFTETSGSIYDEDILNRRFPDQIDEKSQFFEPGHRVFVSPKRSSPIRIISDNGPKDFYGSCAYREEHVSFCGLGILYKRYPDISIQVRMYSPKPPYNFSKIASRMREVIRCLDVTDAVNEGTYVRQHPVDPDGPLPDLKKCSSLVS